MYIFLSVRLSVIVFDWKLMHERAYRHHSVCASKFIRLNVCIAEEQQQHPLYAKINRNEKRKKILFWYKVKVVNAEQVFWFICFTFYGIRITADHVVCAFFFLFHFFFMVMSFILSLLGILLSVVVGYNSTWYCCKKIVFLICFLLCFFFLLVFLKTVLLLQCVNVDMFISGLQQANQNVLLLLSSYILFILLFLIQSVSSKCFFPFLLLLLLLLH